LLSSEFREFRPKQFHNIDSRFIFEGIGFVVSAVAILAGYAIYVRIQNVMAAYLKEVCEKEK
jgi:hypothetical protein